MTSVYLARVLGADHFGLYGFVTALSAYVVLFSNFGIEQFSARRLSAQRNKESVQFTQTVLVTRIFLSLFFTTLFVSFGAVYADTSDITWLFVFQGIFIVAYALNLQFYFIATRTIHILAWIKIGSAISIFLCCYALISTPADLPFVTLINGIVTLFFFSIGVMFAARKESLIFTFPSFDEVSALLRGALPLGISALMIQIYYSIDIVILGFTNPGIDLGFYTGAYRIILVLTSIPGFVYSVFLPHLAQISSNYFGSSITRLYITILVAGGGILTLVVFISAELLIVAILGTAYVPAAGVFKILLVNVFIVFVNVALGNLLIAWNRHKQYLVIVTAGAVINIIANMLLIPAYGIYGAAIATVAAECAVLFSAIYFNHTLFGLFAAKV